MAALTICREPAVGIEPTTARLRIECSTTELRWLASLTRGAPAWSCLESLHVGARSNSSFNALARTRTATPCGTTPSRWRVYQFHHQGNSLDNGADGARTRDLSSDSRVL